MKLLYREACGVSRPTGPFNAGLWYDKFVDLEYEPGSAPKLEKQQWLKSIVEVAQEAWDAIALDEAIQRQAIMAHALGGLVLRFRNASRFVTGLGRTHPVENGFAWHHALGMPYLPGSGLKGVLRAWMRMNGGSGQQDWFGERGRAGDIVFLDLLPVRPPVLCVEIMTPHYAPYYHQNPDDPQAPGDWFLPTPIPFLAVEHSQLWQCALIPRPGAGSWDNGLRNDLRRHLANALSWLGAGAKTAVGYGRFEFLEDATRELEAELAAARETARRAARLARELSRLSPLAAEFHRQRLEGAWDTDKNAFAQSAMYGDWISRLEAEPDATALEMMRELVEKHFPGLLADPDRTEGKRNKPVFKDAQREFARRFNRIAG